MGGDTVARTDVPRAAAAGKGRGKGCCSKSSLTPENIGAALATTSPPKTNDPSR